MTIPTITTPRLTLRPFTEPDEGPLHRLLGEGDVLRYFPSSSPPTREQVSKLISGQLEHWKEHGYGWWAVELRAEPGLIGWSGLTFLPETEEVEVAYLLGRPYWGRGLATEAATAALQYGFDNVDVDRIIAVVHPENAASQRVIEKLGMSFVDEAHYFGIDVYRYWIEVPPASGSDTHSG